MSEVKRVLYQEMIDLIEKRLIQTTSFAKAKKPLDALTDYERGIQVALREVQGLLRNEAKQQ